MEALSVRLFLPTRDVVGYTLDTDTENRVNGTTRLEIEK